MILTQPAIQAVKCHLEYYASQQHAPQNRLVLVDSDGQWFVNYLDEILIAEDDHGPFYKEFDQHKKFIEKKLDTYREKPPIFAKYAWAAGYHNFFCDLHSQYFSDEHKINTDMFRTPPRLIIE